MANFLKLSKGAILNMDLVSSIEIQYSADGSPYSVLVNGAGLDWLVEKSDDDFKALLAIVDKTGVIP